MYKKRNPTIIFFDKILQQLRQKPLATVSTLRFSNLQTFHKKAFCYPSRNAGQRV